GDVGLAYQPDFVLDLRGFRDLLGHARARAGERQVLALDVEPAQRLIDVDARLVARRVERALHGDDRGLRAAMRCVARAPIEQRQTPVRADADRIEVRRARLRTDRRVHADAQVRDALI